MKKIQSTCNYCAIDCNLDFYVEDNKIVKTVPTKGYPVNDGFSCIKGLSLSKQQTTVKPNSLPKIRQKDGSFKEVSWDEAFTHVASELNRIQAEYGTESVAGISTGQLTLEEFAIFGPCDAQLPADECGWEYKALYGNSGCCPQTKLWI